MDRTAWIETTLRTAFSPVHLVVEDDSAQHRGHASAPAGGASHFRVLIVSPAFTGQDLVSRQRAVYAALGDAMTTGIHALALRTLTPEEWQGQGGGREASGGDGTAKGVR